jgi:hypothetical protein
MRATGPSGKVRALVRARDHNRCAVCGRHAGETPNIHHRRNRGAGGSRNPELNLPSNLIVVCGSGTTGCHGKLTENRNRDRALAAGWIISLHSPRQAAGVLVCHAVLGPVYLADDGTFTDAGVWDDLWGEAA